MTAVQALVCTRCGRRYDPDEVAYTCPEHDGIGGILDVRYGESAVEAGVLDGSSSDRGDMWAYERLLPVEERVRLGAGGTPMVSAPTLGERLGVDTLVKDDTGNPTGSTKDRASAVLTSRALERGHAVVACASTGNAAASLAGYAARAGLDCQIVVPADLPAAKDLQPRLYGATVRSVDGGYERAYDRCRSVAADRGWYNCNAAMNPYAVEGTRTLGFEIADQAPAADWVAMPMGNGCSLAAVWKGLCESERRGDLTELPGLLGVQAAGATAIHDRFVAEREATAADGGDAAAADRGRDPAGGGVEQSGTDADSIDVHDPHNAERACRALAESGGDTAVVTDDEIAAAQSLLGGTEGVFVEPASAAAVAGVRRAREDGVLEADDRVVVVATGSGLKDTATARRALEADHS